MVGAVMMEKTGGDKLMTKNSQQSDLYNYNLDHVYCSDNSRYRTAMVGVGGGGGGTGGGGGGTHLNLAAAAADLKSLRKENKQLQAMLLLHLDLIQEQSNQLIAKDKQLLQLREDNAQLRLKCERNMAAERRQNNNRYTMTTTASGGKLLNTSGGSPTIDSYFQTATDSKIVTNNNRTLQQQQQHQQHYHDTTGKLKSQNIITINQNATINSNSSDENQAINDIHRNNQMTTIPIKVEVNTTTPDEPTSSSSSSASSMMKMMIQQQQQQQQQHLNAFSDIGHQQQQQQPHLMSKDRFKTILTPTTITSHDKPITTVKYRTVDNSIIGNNNGKLISKIILQRKKSENGEKIFVRTKNIDMSNNKVSYEKWSPLRTIKNEVIECSELECEPIVLEAIKTTTTTTITTNSTTSMSMIVATASTIATTTTPSTTTITSPTSSNTAAIQDDDISSDAMETSYLTNDMSPPPSIKTQTITPTTLMDHSDLSTDCQIDEIKIEQDDIQYDADDDNDLVNSPVYDPNSTLEDSQDTSNIESSLASDLAGPLSATTIPTPGSPITSTVSTCDFNQSEMCLDNNSMSTTMTTNIGSTILYPSTRRHINRNAFLTTKKPYKIREWQLDEIEAELKQEITDEVCKEENDANLELPKWRTWELSSNREVPVTAREWEDLSDETFARRHARFLLDERKRKKWDVQRIREQRTIERLKRRHCKDELNQQKDFVEVVTTFFPTVDQLKSIQITDDLPVSAFGESIPALPPTEFSLPWQIGQTIGLNEQKYSEFLNAPTPAIKSRSNSICSSVSINEPSTPTNVSSIIFLATKKRAGRTRTSTITSTHTIPTNSKTNSTT